MSERTMHPARIAVIEDEAPIRRFLRASLLAEGYHVEEAEDAKNGMRLLTQYNPDLVLLDLGLPDRDGKEIVAEIRGWSSVPIVVLSARDREREKVAALDAGADDYLTKPFGVGELLARIRVALRHHARLAAPDGQQPSSTFRAGPLFVDLGARRVLLGGEELKLTKLEYDLLSVLVRHAGRVLTHRFLLKEVWGPNSVYETHYLRVFVANLRKKLEPEPARPRFIHTEQGVGYRFADPD